MSRKTERTRPRMLAALLLCAATVLAAATPGIALAVGDLSDARRRVDAAGLATRATVLAQTLADERDTLAVFAAAGRPAAHGPGLAAADRERADRQAGEVTPGAPAAVRTALAGLPAVRSTALTGHGGAQAVVTAYQPLIDALAQVTGPVTAPLGRAADAASVERALLVSALTAGGPQRTLVTAAQAARIQERAAVAEFRATASAALRARYDQTVTGPDADRAEHDLTVLLAGTELTPAGRALGAPGVNSALSARLSLMRSVEASAATDEAHSAAGHRGHQVTVLELRIALALLCLLLLVGVLVNLFRSVTRPLAALHRWSRSDAESGEGAEVLGNDEFAAVARRVNALTHEAQALRARSQELTAARTAAADAGTALAAEREGLLRTQEDLLRSREELAGRLTAATAQNAAQITFVNLSLRTLGLVERQLTLIEGMEDQEQDPDRLEGLFKLDHLATRMRRNSENLLVLTGTEHAHGATARPVALVDVARAAVSEIERYERVRIDSVPDAGVAGRAADDVSHLIAELLDNATAFSDPAAEILLSGWLMETGEVMLSVSDTGIGVPAGRLDDLNEMLADPDPAAPGAASGMGLYVVARLAHRHGVRVQLRPHAQGGTAAVVVLPQLLLPSLDPQAPPVTPVTPAPFAAPSAETGLPLPGIPAPRTPDTAPERARPAHPAVSDEYGLLSEPGLGVGFGAPAGAAAPGDLDGLADPAAPGDFGLLAESAAPGDFELLADPAAPGDFGPLSDPAATGDFGPLAGPGAGGAFGTAAQPGPGGGPGLSAETAPFAGPGRPSASAPAADARAGSGAEPGTPAPSADARPASTAGLPPLPTRRSAANPATAAPAESATAAAPADGRAPLPSRRGRPAGAPDASQVHEDAQGRVSGPSGRQGASGPQEGTQGPELGSLPVRDLTRPQTAAQSPASGSEEARNVAQDRGGAQDAVNASGGPRDVARAARPAPAPGSTQDVAPEAGHAQAAPAGPAARGRVTAKGLPQRVPRTRTSGGTGEGGGERAVGGVARGPVDADRLRQRLGGLQQGLQAGRRDAERETGGTTGPASGPSQVPGEPGQVVASPAATEEATR
ncbi:nitrate- and nitrite sensing domain-containing protein [Streptomyces sp. NPDC020917]|uniref:sensor histidine kinase n=1 Tax=Streptomyces sp. NPDC020917 TaxID=3365102 RepID=UPI0037920B33